jgi:pyruvate dehydrogenase E2 component (dihydrolipoamide acetyltransferase)
MIPRDLIAGLPMPVTVVWGEEDQVLDPRHADGLPTAIAVRRIARRGHMLLEECPDEVAMLIRRATAS